MNEEKIKELIKHHLTVNADTLATLLTREIASELSGKEQTTDNGEAFADLIASLETATSNLESVESEVSSIQDQIDSARSELDYITVSTFEVEEAKGLVEHAQELVAQLQGGKDKASA